MRCRLIAKMNDNIANNLNFSNFNKYPLDVAFTTFNCGRTDRLNQSYYSSHFSHFSLFNTSLVGWHDLLSHFLPRLLARNLEFIDVIFCFPPPDDLHDEVSGVPLALLSLEKLEFRWFSVITT